MNNVTQESLELKLAWLAGLFDGEGSVGLIYGKSNPGKPGNRCIMRAQIQLVMTHDETVREAVRILRLIGVDTLIYCRFAERKAKYKDVSRFGITRYDLCRITAQHLIPYTVTKKPHWETLLTFLNSRFQRCGTSSNGRIGRFGHRSRWPEYNELEMAAYNELKRLNTRCKQEDEQPIIKLDSKIIAKNASIQLELGI